MNIKNRFFKRGIIALVIGIALNILGYVMKSHEMEFYGWTMIVGTILFGIGFLLIFYSIVRKVEHQGIVEERADDAEKLSKHKLEVE
ncbi:MAG: signal peptidase [Pyrinomonadaceae bacterium]|nr:signal peptidase [Sphingobacteriaceae bacterium]